MRFQGLRWNGALKHSEWHHEVEVPDRNCFPMCGQDHSLPYFGSLPVKIFIVWQQPHWKLKFFLDHPSKIFVLYHSLFNCTIATLWSCKVLYLLRWAASWPDMVVEISGRKAHINIYQKQLPLNWSKQWFCQNGSENYPLLAPQCQILQRQLDLHSTKIIYSWQWHWRINLLQWCHLVKSYQ